MALAAPAGPAQSSGRAESRALETDSESGSSSSVRIIGPGRASTIASTFLIRTGTLPTDARELRHAATMPITYDTSDPTVCGVWKARQLVGLVLGIVSFVLCCWARPIKTYDQASHMLGIICLCGAFWVFEVLPICITALLPMILLPLCKVTSAEIVAGAYWNSIQMLFVAMYLVDIALEEAHVPELVALRVMLQVGTVSPSKLLLLCMSIAWFMSMFMNTIVVALMITPFVVGLINLADDAARDEASEDSDVGSASSKARADRSVGDVHRVGKGLLLGIAYAGTAGGMATLTGSIPNRILVGLDLVTQEITWVNWFCFAAPLSLVTVSLAYFILWLQYIRGATRVGIAVEHLEADYRTLLEIIGRRDVALVGLMQLLQITVLAVYSWAIAPYMKSGYGAPLVSDAVVALIPAVLLFVIPSQQRDGHPLLTWNIVQEKLDFGVLLLIGGGFALSKGLTESGLDQVMGDKFAEATSAIPAVWITGLVLVAGSVCTQIFSTVGCATVLLPILSAASVTAVDNPLRMALPGTIACSLAFALPTATPANIVVLAKSQDAPKPLEVQDFVRSGGPLTILAIIACTVLTMYSGEAVLHSLRPFPASSCGFSVSNCVFLDIAGEVQGYSVDAQACMYVDEGKGRCRLWNGTVVKSEDFVSDGEGVDEPVPEPFVALPSAAPADPAAADL